jgi:putative hemolysin
MLLTAIAVVFLLIVLNGVFAASELAVVSSRKSKLQSRADRGDAGAAAALRLSENPNRFLSAVQVGITLIGILAGAFGQATIAAELDSILERTPALAPYSEGASTAIVVVLLTYVSLIVGELVPKRVALIFPEALAGVVARPLTLMAKLLGPFVWLLTASTTVVLRLFRVRDAKGESITQEEVETVLTEGTSAGLIEPGEQAIISEVLRLGERPVRAAMTPRGDVHWISSTDSPEQIRAEVRQCPYARLVVSDGETVDRPTGVLHKKDVLDRLLDGGDLDVSDLVQTPLFLPDSLTVLQALEQFKTTTVHMALVIDEFGAFQGVVTATDLLEMIAGDFPEAHDGAAGEVRREIVRREDGSLLVDGRADLMELADALDEDLIAADERYHTAAGLVISRLGRIPAEGDGVDVGRWRAEVVDVDERRVDKLLFIPRHGA